MLLLDILCPHTPTIKSRCFCYSLYEFPFVAADLYASFRIDAMFFSSAGAAYPPVFQLANPLDVVLSPPIEGRLPEATGVENASRREGVEA